MAASRRPSSRLRKNGIAEEVGLAVQEVLDRHDRRPGGGLRARGHESLQLEEPLRAQVEPQALAGVRLEAREHSQRPSSAAGRSQALERAQQLLERHDQHRKLGLLQEAECPVGTRGVRPHGVERVLLDARDALDLAQQQAASLARSMPHQDDAVLQPDRQRRPCAEAPHVHHRDVRAAPAHVAGDVGRRAGKRREQDSRHHLQHVAQRHAEPLAARGPHERVEALGQRLDRGQQAERLAQGDHLEPQPHQLARLGLRRGLRHDGRSAQCARSR